MALKACKVQSFLHLRFNDDPSLHRLAEVTRLNLMLEELFLQLLDFLGRKHLETF